MNDGTIPQFRSTRESGYSAVVDSLPGRVLARKLALEVTVEFAAAVRTLETAEGIVNVHPGDAIVTGSGGEQWRVSRAHFENKYRAVAPTTTGMPGRYEALRSTVMAVQMNRPFEALLEDGVSRLTGKVGDWLVDYGDGSLGIVAATIFAKTYEVVA